MPPSKYSPLGGISGFQQPAWLFQEEDVDVLGSYDEQLRRQQQEIADRRFREAEELRASLRERYGDSEQPEITQEELIRMIGEQTGDPKAILDVMQQQSLAAAREDLPRSREDRDQIARDKLNQPKRMNVPPGGQIWEFGPDSDPEMILEGAPKPLKQPEPTYWINSKFETDMKTADDVVGQAKLHAQGWRETNTPLGKKWDEDRVIAENTARLLKEAEIEDAKPGWWKRNFGEKNEDAPGEGLPPGAPAGATLSNRTKNGKPVYDLPGGGFWQE